jgi:dTMP kinase
MLITFEGLDASGKSTQAEEIHRRLKTEGLDVLSVREPGGSGLGEHVRSVLLDVKNHIDPIAEILLFSAARAQLVCEVIRPALERGKIVMCDRYVDSTTAYQGYGRGIPLETVRLINRIAIGKTFPDITFFIDVSVDTLELRQRQAGKIADRMEIAGREFFERVRNGFLEIAKTEKRFRIIDGDRPEAVITSEIWDILVTVLRDDTADVYRHRRFNEQEGFI